MPYANRSEGKRPRTYASGSLSERLTEQALAFAAQGEWAQAAKTNRELLLSHPRDVRSLNRLGNCMTQLGDYKSATAAYSRTLEYDRQNDIALKNLGRLTLLAENKAPGGAAPVTTQHSYVVDAGRSTIATLREPVNHEALAALSPGAELELKAEGGSLHAYDHQGRSVGALDPHLALRLLLLMQGGNTYAASLISVAPGNVRVVIRETYRHPGQANLASFVAQSDTQAVHAQTSGATHPSLEEDADEDEEGDEDGTAAVVPAEAEYPEAEISAEERDPFANDAPRVQVGD